MDAVIQLRQVALIPGAQQHFKPLACDSLHTHPQIILLGTHQEDKDAFLGCKLPLGDRTSRKQVMALLSIKGRHLHGILRGSLSSTTLYQCKPFSSYEGPFLIIKDKYERKTQNCACVHVC